MSRRPPAPRQVILSALLLAAALGVVGFASAFEPRGDAAAAGVAASRRGRVKNRARKKQFYQDVYIRFVTKLNGVEICFEDEAPETLAFLQAFHAAFFDVYGPGPRLQQLKIEEYSAEKVDESDDSVQKEGAKQKGKNKFRPRELTRRNKWLTRLRKRARVRIREDGGSNQLVEDSQTRGRRELLQFDDDVAAAEGKAGGRRLDASLSQALLKRLREHGDFSKVETAHVTIGLQADQTWDEMQQDASAVVECRSVAEVIEQDADVADLQGADQQVDSRAASYSPPPPPEGPSLPKVIETATAENEQPSTEMDKAAWKAEKNNGKDKAGREAARNNGNKGKKL